MACYGNKHLIAAYEELPIVNGKRIHSIYGRMETAYYHKGRLLEDAYNEKPDYYMLCTDDRDHSQGTWHNRKKFPPIRTKELPIELAQFFGSQNVDGYKVDVTRLWFRTSDSGHGGGIDQFCDFEGGCGAQHKSITYYRTKRWTNWSTGTGAIFEKEEYSKKIDKILGKKFTVEEVPEWYNVEYPVCYIRRVDGMNYPDVKCSGWRHDSPYIAMNYNANGTPDLKHIRVYVEELKAHYYLEKADAIEEGEENLVTVDFSNDYDKHPEHFCRLGQWNHSKIEDPSGIVKWKVLAVKEKYFEMGAMINDKIQFKRNTDGYNLYRINRLNFFS